MRHSNPAWCRIAVVLCLAASVASADKAPKEKERVISVKTPGGIYKFRFDPARLPEKMLRAAVAVGPHAEAPGLGMVLEDCDPSDGSYRKCEDTPETAAFFHNAKVNIDRAVRKYQKFKAVEVPEEMASAKEHLKRAGAFYIWLQKTRLEYYRTVELHVLKKKFADIEPESKCEASLEKISQAKKRAEAFRLARTDWHNCVNVVFEKRYGKYPMDVWNAFVTKYGIKDASDEPVSRDTADVEPGELPVRAATEIEP